MRPHGAISPGVVLVSLVAVSWAVGGDPGHAVSGPSPRAVQDLATTVWAGVYSEEQAARGEQVYRRRCRKCHRRDLSGDGALQGDGSEVVPSLVGFSFEQRWDGVTVADMFLTVSRAMPWDAPGTVSPQQNIDVVSYLLEMNGIPAGAAELPADTERLDRIGITAQPPG